MQTFLIARRWLHAVSAAAEHVAWAILLVWVLLITVGVVARYVLAAPLLIQVDLVSGLLVVFCGLCFGQLLVEHSHVRVATLVSRMRPALRRSFWFATHLATLIYAVLILASTATLLQFSLLLGAKFDISGMPLWPFQICIPIGFGLIAMLSVVECVYTLSPQWRPEDVEG